MTKWVGIGTSLHHGSFDKDDSKQIIGVAGMGFSFVYIIEQLLDLPGVEEVESFGG